MSEMVCIVCPNSCVLTAEETNGEIKVTGNKCKRGIAFAKAELTSPKRTLCSTVRTAFPEMPVLPVRTSAEIPKERIFDVMAELNKVTLTEKVKCGEPIIKDVLSLGSDIIATSDLN